MRCPKCGKPLVCAACAGSVGGAARVAKGFASAEVQAKAQATRKRKARAARNSHNAAGQGRREATYPEPACSQGGCQ
jgi:hypothetical protein